MKSNSRLVSVAATVLTAAALSFSAAASNSWYDDVGIEKGILKVRELTPRLAADLAPAIAPSSASCLVSVLEKIGWKVKRSTTTDYVLFTNGVPCERSSLDETWAEGGLTIEIPERMDDAALQSALMPILGSPTSLCAYKFRVRSAAARSVANLDRNQDFSFYMGGWPYVKFSRPSLWQGSCVSGGSPSCFFPNVPNHQALNDFTTGKIAADCAIGLQAAEYGTLHVLFGDAGMDQKFNSNEIVFAPWAVLHQTQSATWGKMTNDDSVIDQNAVETSKLGAQAFVGLSGYIGNVYGEAFLDTPIDRGENFATVSVSLRAAAELKLHGGFEYFNRQNVRAFQLGRLLNPALEEMALTNLDPDRLPATTEVRAAFRELQSILASPVYQQVKVWVHPLGTTTLGDHIVRQLRLNPRTPYSFSLYPSRVNRGLFLRYVNAQLASCGR